MPNGSKPSYKRGQLEKELSKEYSRIACVDEVGRGCIAGPAFVGLVVLNYRRLAYVRKTDKALIRDSKTLSHNQRQQITPKIYHCAQSVAIAMATVGEIEEFGIVPAINLAIKRCVASIETIDYLLMDGPFQIPGLDAPQQGVPKGDNLCFGIAAASILAKEARDKYMKQRALDHPGYGFETNMGYGTKEHLHALQANGPLPIHRHNFAPIRDMVST